MGFYFWRHIFVCAGLVEHLAEGGVCSFYRGSAGVRRGKRLGVEGVVGEENSNFQLSQYN